MSECEKYEEMISALLDGELSRSDAAELRDHVQSCPSCRQVYKDFSAVSNYTRMLPDEAPFVLSSKVMIQTEDLPTPAVPVEPAKKRRKSPLRVIVPIAAACIILAVGITAVNNIRKVGNIHAEASQVSESAVYEDNSIDAAEADDGPAEAVMVFDAEIPAADETEDSSTANNTAEIPSYIVPDDIESEFESIITVGDGPTMDPASLTILCYAEYRGVVYEFLTNDDQSSLYWMDAAEGTEAIYSGSSVSELFAILDAL